MKTQNDASARTLSLKRMFNVPVKLVWEAWTQPEHIVHWWAPKGMKLTVVEHSFKVGGKWKYNDDYHNFNYQRKYLWLVNSFSHLK